MKLIKHTPTKCEDGENVYTSVIEMTSDDPYELESKAHDLCKLMGIDSSLWGSKFPIMGTDKVEPNRECFMELSNGIIFTIEK